jgi:hypothetical protein
MIIIERKRRVEKANESSLFQMITSTGGGGGSMELIIAKPLFLPIIHQKKRDLIVRKIKPMKSN